MLPKKHRLRSAAEFSATVRSGARSGRRNVVLYAVLRSGQGLGEPSRFGFIVSKSVGNAVTRNLVKRRLRAVAAGSLADLGAGYDVVVRALPHSAGTSWSELASEARTALGTAMRTAAAGPSNHKRKVNRNG